MGDTIFEWHVTAYQAADTGRWGVTWRTVERSGEGAPRYEGSVEPRWDTAQEARGYAFMWIARMEDAHASPTSPAFTDPAPSIPTADELREALAAHHAQFGQPDIRLGSGG